MFLRRTTRTHKGKTYVNYQLVESVRTPKGPRQNTICSLGDLGPGPREEWARRARKLEHAVAGQEDLLERSDPEVDRVLEKAKAKHAADAQQPAQMPGLGSDDGGHITVDPKLITTERHREAGTVHVGYQFWRRLGLAEILEQQGLSERVGQLACAMTLNRLIHPVSENAMPAWIRRTALADILGRDFDDLGEDALYRVLDALHPHRGAIETALVERERSLFNLDPTVYLYDLTSTYFEGLAAANPKAKRGHTRDGRPDCKQVVIGLVVGREGFPICHEVFAGNTQDVTTLETMLDRLAARGCLTAGATIVMDRGMAEPVRMEPKCPARVDLAWPFGAHRTLMTPRLMSPSNTIHSTVPPPYPPSVVRSAILAASNQAVVQVLGVPGAGGRLGRRRLGNVRKAHLASGRRGGVGLR
jgi:Transposase DDE domain